MRILMTTDTIGGVWRFTRELSNELLKNGCELALISLGRRPSVAQSAWVESQRVRWGTRFVFRACDVPLEWMQENVESYTAAEPFLMSAIREFDPELILSSQFCFGALPCEIPRVVVAHSDVLSWARACRPAGLTPSRWLDTYCELVTAGLSRADAVVAPSRWMLDALAANFELPPQSLVIANGLTLSSTPMSGGRKLQAVTAGRLWDEAKNVQILERVKSPMPLLIAGEMEHDSEGLKFSGNSTSLLGSLAEEELLRLFRESAIYICPSVYEPFGLAPLEAALCGCAVVANDIPSLREVWGDGALYFSGAESLSGWLYRLSTDEAVLTKAQEHALRRAREFTSARMGEQYLSLFRSMLMERVVESHVA